MNIMQAFSEAISFRIHDGNTYYDARFGLNAFALSFWNEKNADGGISADIIFDTVTNVVYRVELCDYEKQRAYSWEAPHVTPPNGPVVAFEGVNGDDITFCTTEIVEDILEKIKAAAKGEPYDERVIVPLNLTNEEFMLLAKAAHAKDVTFNEFVTLALEEVLAKPEGGGIMSSTTGEP